MTTPSAVSSEDTVELQSKWTGIQEEKADSNVLSLILDHPTWIVPKRQAARGSSDGIKTHLILSGEHGGVLSVPDRDHEMFMDAYCRDIACGIRHYFCEEKTDIFPLAVDLDHKPKSVDDRWKKEHIYIWIRTFQTVLKNCYSFLHASPDHAEQDDQEKYIHDPFLCLVTCRDGDFIYHQNPERHGELLKKDFKQGYRLSFPNLLVTCDTARTIRQCVIRELMANATDCRFLFRLEENAVIGEAVCKQLDAMLDESVYRTNGFRMIGSAKVTNSLCGKKKDPCLYCYKRFKFDIGGVYKFWTALPSVAISDTDRIRLNQMYSGDIQRLIRACSVRAISSSSARIQETAGFRCTYDLSTFLLATRYGAQSLSTEQKRAVVRTQRFIDPANKDDRLKYDVLLRYFHETTFPDGFPFHRLLFQDIKSIHLHTSTQTPTFTILMNVRFCAIKKQDHSTPKSYFVFHPKHGLRQKCQSETCKKEMEFYEMPRPSVELYQLFFPSDCVVPVSGPGAMATSVATGSANVHQPQLPVVMDRKQTIEQMMKNVGSYFQSQNEMPLRPQIIAMQNANKILHDRLQAFSQFCRDVPHANSSENMFDPTVLTKRYRDQQGTENHVFRAPAFRGGGRGGGGGRSRSGGRGGSREGYGGGRKRTRSRSP